MRYNILLLITVLMCSIIIALPSTTVYSFPQGYTIVPIEFEQLKAGEDIYFNFYVYNSSTGVRMDNTTINCSFHLSDSQGNLILDGDESYDSRGFWYVLINGSYVNTSGYYYYGVDCQDGFGGAFTEVLEITPSGNKLTTANSIVLIFSLFIILIIGLCFLYLGIYYQNNLATITFYTFSVIVFIIVILSMVVMAQQNLYAFAEILNTVENFWFISSIAIWIGFLVLLIVIALVMIKAWKIKRGFYE
jgi:hypothetical protein